MCAKDLKDHNKKVRIGKGNWKYCKNVIEFTDCFRIHLTLDCQNCKAINKNTKIVVFYLFLKVHGSFMCKV